MSRQVFLRFFLAMSMVTAGLTSVLVFSAADAAPRTRPVAGLIFSEPLTGPECDSPVGFCATGTFTGSIRGPFEGTTLRVQPSLTPGLFFIDTKVVVHTRDGDLLLEDASAINLTPGEAGERVVLSRVTGTGGLEGVYGYLLVTGDLANEPGNQTRYRGHLTYP